jgi:hypothetical protein
MFSFPSPVVGAEREQRTYDWRPPVKTCWPVRCGRLGGCEWIRTLTRLRRSVRFELAVVRQRAPSSKERIKSETEARDAIDPACVESCRIDLVGGQRLDLAGSSRLSSAPAAPDLSALRTATAPQSVALTSDTPQTP